MLNVFCLEWSDPPFAAGHWVPEMVEAAAGVNLLSEKGGPSRVVTHRQIRDANPEAIVFMPCGYYLEEAEEEAAPILTHAELRETSAVRNGNVFAVDATSYFSRPGPRVVDGLEILAWALHPDAYPTPPPTTISKIA
jgi:iron complex transport system substrate-binding protein